MPGIRTTALARIREQRHDVYLIDYRLGSQTGLELVREAFAARPRAPVIILTGRSDYEIDLEATALGVTDYLIKQQLDPCKLGAFDPLRRQSHKALNDSRSVRSATRWRSARPATASGIGI